jgi:hypothetical protein
MSGYDVGLFARQLEQGESKRTVALADDGNKA